jgi:hypothetical protein
MSNPQHFNDEYDFTNDDGYSSLYSGDEIRDEWLNEEEEYWSEQELDPADTDNYDPVDESDNCEAVDEWDGEEWDDTPIGLEYDGYNDPDNF